MLNEPFLSPETETSVRQSFEALKTQLETHFNPTTNTLVRTLRNLSAVRQANVTRRLRLWLDDRDAEIADRLKLDAIDVWSLSDATIRAALERVG